MQPQLLRLREVRVMIGMSSASIYRGVSSGSFPAPVKVGAASRWRLSDLLAWMEDLQTT